jgi:2-polyprenyl-6-methoxyphenol hydroxylase-like FAD-dependent oxidoreductase
MHTVEIIGGGLAGLALGLGLRARGVPVRIIEAGKYPRHRVCGEFITGLDHDTRRELQLTDILAGARQARGVLWSEPGRPSVRHDLPEVALCLSRYHLDESMASAFATAGGDLRTGCRGPSDAKPGRIMASGRRPQAGSRWVGLKQHFHQLDLREDLELHLGQGAYVGLTRIEGRAVNVCGLFPRPGRGEACGLIDRVRAAGLASLALRLESATPVEASACAVAGLDYGRPASQLAALGDYHGLIPPFTGHGMTVAMQSAALAARRLEPWARGRFAWDETLALLQQDLRRRFARKLAWGRVLHPWLLAPHGRRVVHLLHRWGALPLGPLYRLCH